MKMRRKLLAAVSSLAVMSTVLLAGCGTAADQGAAQETGALILSVNPEVRIAYDEEGRVTDLTGSNEDGKTVVNGYDDYAGKECEEVLGDLIKEIYEAGYFAEDVDGNKRNVVLQLASGSQLPEDGFLEDMNAEAAAVITDLGLTSGIVMIGDDDYDPAYAKDGKPSPYITLEKAREIALAQANVSAADAVFVEKEFDHDDGTPVFELEFSVNGNKYEYDIHAETGKVVKAEHEVITVPGGTQQTGGNSYDDTDYGPNNDGVTNYDDTDYGPNNDGVTDYGNSGYGNSNYDDGGDSGYDD